MCTQRKGAWEYRRREAALTTARGPLMGVAAVARQMILVAAEAKNRFRGQMAATIFPG
jgi:hypothetical protein